MIYFYCFIGHSKLGLWWDPFTQTRKCELKIYRGVICLDNENDAKFREEWLTVSKLAWGVWQIFTRSLGSLKNCTLMGSFWTKYIMFELKNYREVISHNTEEQCKIWSKTDFWFGKWQEEYDKSSNRALKSLKIGTLMGSFYPKLKVYKLKIYRGVICHDNDAKFI